MNQTDEKLEHDMEARVSRVYKGFERRNIVYVVLDWLFRHGIIV